MFRLIFMIIVFIVIITSHINKCVRKYLNVVFKFF